MMGHENSRFLTLMTAQLNAAVGESMYLGPARDLSSLTILVL